MTDNIATSVVMVEPAAFGYNPETAESNSFQHHLKHFTNEQIQDIALLEFRNMVNVLKENGITVHTYKDQPENRTPDSIFPNNWFSTFSDEIILYPMFSPSRQRERRSDIYDFVSSISKKKVNDLLVALENEGKILEGTGSLVCDHASKTAFAAISPRTHREAIDAFQKVTGYHSVRFKALGPKGEEIYHTNVMMTMGDSFCILGADTIALEDRHRVIGELKERGKALIYLSNEQVYEHFAGNMLQLANKEGEKFVVMSSEAYRSLEEDQIEQIKLHENKIIHVPLHVIETIGGGSARCMMAEFYNPNA
ncbi:hypothetical protein GYB29_09870 [bacterium]|nr:hypothetical protein [bacterium]